MNSDYSKGNEPAVFSYRRPCPLPATTVNLVTATVLAQAATTSVVHSSRMPGRLQTYVKSQDEHILLPSNTGADLGTGIHLFLNSSVRFRTCRSLPESFFFPPGAPSSSLRRQRGAEEGETRRPHNETKKRRVGDCCHSSTVSKRRGRAAG